jgi:hypothetical protein
LRLGRQVEVATVLLCVGQLQPAAVGRGPQVNANAVETKAACGCR